MGDIIHLYSVDKFPVREMILPCGDGYCVYVKYTSDPEERFEAYKHALAHIQRGDFDNGADGNVQSIEDDAHSLDEVRIIPPATERHISGEYFEWLFPICRVCSTYRARGD